MNNIDPSLSRRLLLAALATAVITLGTGCLITANSHETRKGTYVSESTFAQIRTGQTTEDWVRATLGPPTSETVLQDGGRILKWSYTEHHESSGAVFLIFGGHSEKDTDHTAYVETHDGVVSKAWRT